MRWVRGVAEACALVVVTLVLFAVVGVMIPLPQPGVNTDRLGPDNGETVANYTSRSVQSVQDAAADEDLHWALVSFAAATSPATAYESAGGTRIAQVLIRVPMDRVQTPSIVVGVPGTEQSVLASEDTAASGLHGSTGQWDRQSQIDAASLPRLAAGCDCVVGLVVHASGISLRSIQATSGVRTVEALPSDAVAGRFAVRALLPDYVDVVGALPDDGPIPPP
ncbi:hypothetical protein A2J03_13450 [Rhodococcus sp. EPR-157]|jgi:hypothetical protein|uniref:hypothetical protein n=1 Tax=Rhodococcus sp. EPR-157 TaxID=1813677 RepID=UPI0007BB2C51|nr:hypothetical protein [Rhodococcus sp. EPR-157]KZE98625.1 hypothetical protein A2J03_13450 [Rhodococcus sp. EPR-157]